MFVLRDISCVWFFWCVRCVSVRFRARVLVCFIDEEEEYIIHFNLSLPWTRENLFMNANLPQSNLVLYSFKKGRGGVK